VESSSFACVVRTPMNPGYWISEAWMLERNLRASGMCARHLEAAAAVAVDGLERRPSSKRVRAWLATV